MLTLSGIYPNDQIPQCRITRIPVAVISFLEWVLPEWFYNQIENKIILTTVLNTGVLLVYPKNLLIIHIMPYWVYWVQVLRLVFIIFVLHCDRIQSPLKCHSFFFGAALIFFPKLSSARQISISVSSFWNSVKAKYRYGLWFPNTRRNRLYHPQLALSVRWLPTRDAWYWFHCSGV